MKQANQQMMHVISKQLYPTLRHDQAMAKMKADNLFVKMKNGKTYSIMDKIYELLMD